MNYIRIFMLPIMAGALVVPDSCLQCICESEGCDSHIGQCRVVNGSLSCGPFQIKKLYWITCGSPGEDYRTCTESKSCSQQCVRAYLRKFGRRCTGGRLPNCLDYARIHKGGPYGCKRSYVSNIENITRFCEPVSK